MFGLAYDHGLIKNGSSLFMLWCWLSYQRWYQIAHIPYHYILGFYYGYNIKQITYFCLGILRERKYKQQYKTKKLSEDCGK